MGYKHDAWIAAAMGHQGQISIISIEILQPNLACVIPVKQV